MTEIIPKPATETSFWKNAFFYFFVSFLLAVVLSYFVLDIYLDGAETKLKEKEEIAAREKTAEEIDMENKLRGYEKKIKDFSILINRHLFSSTVFEFIEKNTHPDVWFSELDLNLQKGKVGLLGETENFVTLRQQVQIFKADPSVKSIDLDEIAIGEEGRVSFNINLTLDSGLFRIKYNE